MPTASDAPPDLMGELSAAMEVVTIPNNDTSTSERVQPMDMSDAAPSNLPARPQRAELQTPQETDQRPFDTVASAGPAANPVDFPQPRFERGKRADVLCYNPETGHHDVVKNVLFRDYTREFPDDGDTRVQRAYWPIPYKEPIKTIMGHVEISLVLTRCVSQTDDDSDDSYDDDADDDIVFQITKEYVAVKVNCCERMEALRNKHAENPLTEIAAVQMIGEQHPNVLGCKDVLFDGNNLNVVMDFCDSGDLFQLLQGSQREGDNPGMTEGQARYWFRQVMAGVQFLHSIGICHRDLSPENVMIDGNGCLIIDMGMCLRVPYTDPKSPGKVIDISQGTSRRLFTPQGACGKLPYMSPEIYRNRHDFDGAAADVWTAGTIFFCMVTGNRSYQRPHPSDPQFYWMSRGLTQLLSDWHVTMSPQGIHLLQNMLQIDQRLRLTIDEVVNHPWFDHPDEPVRFNSI